jgi:uncharacterized protein involved in outer membrane biogenesis
MRRGLKIAAIVVGGFVALLAMLLLVLSLFDWNRAKPWISEKVSAATLRTFAINGDLSLSWDRPVQQQGWKRLIPWPHFRAQQVVLGNPDWATTGPHMANVQQVDFALNLLPLFQKTIRIPSLVLTEPRLILEADKGARNNWTFPKKEENPSKWQLDIDNLGIQRGTVRYVDPVKKADVTARLNTAQDGTVSWTLDGRFNEEKLTGNGQAGALLSLQAAKVKYPVKAMLKVGETTITADGTLTDPAHLSALDINLKILGASMSDLFPLSGVILPSTPKFSTEGRVFGNLTPGSMHLTYKNFKGKVGASDIGGTLEYLQQDPRPLLRGAVTSHYLNFKDLAPIIGAGKQEKDAKEIKKAPPGKVLPVEPFKTDRWNKMDVQVEFTGEKIIRSEKLPIDNLYTKIKMDNGALSLAPLNFGIAGGKLTTELNIQGQSDPAKARMKITARGVKINQLFPSVEAMQASVGQLSANAQLSATGNSVAALLASSDGEVKALISSGSISKFILEAMGLNISSVIATKLFGDKQVQLNCMATDFNVKNGMMRTDTFLIDTDNATINVGGNINLAKETLDLTIRPESKGLRIISLRSPLYVAGTFKNPDVGVDKASVARKAGVAAVLGAVAAPAAALLALVNPGPGEDSPCAKLLAEARQKPVAPPPGKDAEPSSKSPTGKK